MSELVKVALINFVGTLVLVLLNRWWSSQESRATNAKVADVVHKVEEVHKATNSLVDKLVATTRSDALQEGRTEGAADTKAGRA